MGKKCLAAGVASVLLFNCGTAAGDGYSVPEVFAAPPAYIPSAVAYVPPVQVPPVSAPPAPEVPPNVPPPYLPPQAYAPPPVFVPPIAFVPPPLPPAPVLPPAAPIVMPIVPQCDPAGPMYSAYTLNHIQVGPVAIRGTFAANQNIGKNRLTGTFAVPITFAPNSIHTLRTGELELSIEETWTCAFGMWNFVRADGSEKVIVRTITPLSELYTHIFTQVTGSSTVTSEESYTIVRNYERTPTTRKTEYAIDGIDQYTPPEIASDPFLPGGPGPLAAPAPAPGALAEPAPGSAPSLDEADPDSGNEPDYSDMPVLFPPPGAGMLAGRAILSQPGHIKRTFNASGTINETYQNKMWSATGNETLSVSYGLRGASDAGFIDMAHLQCDATIDGPAPGRHLVSSVLDDDPTASRPAFDELHSDQFAPAYKCRYTGSEHFETDERTEVTAEHKPVYFPSTELRRWFRREAWIKNDELVENRDPADDRFLESNEKHSVTLIEEVRDIGQGLLANPFVFDTTEEWTEKTLMISRSGIDYPYSYFTHDTSSTGIPTKTYVREADFSDRGIVRLSANTRGDGSLVFNREILGRDELRRSLLVSENGENQAKSFALPLSAEAAAELRHRVHPLQLFEEVEAGEGLLQIEPHTDGGLFEMMIEAAQQVPASPTEGN